MARASRARIRSQTESTSLQADSGACSPHLADLATTLDAPFLRRSRTTSRFSSGVDDFERAHHFVVLVLE